LKDVEIWLPHHEITELGFLHTDAPAETMHERGRKVWLHHGSSISHGSNADSPTTTWPALAGSRGGVQLVNLGFGGGALLDPFVARVMRDTPADLIRVKIGINLVNTDLMRVRAFAPASHGFLDTIREGHPTAPLLVVSPLLCPIHEDTPGPATSCRCPTSSIRAPLHTAASASPLPRRPSVTAVRWPPGTPEQLRRSRGPSSRSP